MASAGPQPHNDDFDDDLDDILKDVVEPESVVPSTEPPTQPEPWRKNKNQSADAGLGVDDEIVITKKRQPAPKLDDQRLLSDPGIPRLRRIAKDRLRFKGKGHEVCARETAFAMHRRDLFTVRRYRPHAKHVPTLAR